MRALKNLLLSFLTLLYLTINPSFLWAAKSASIVICAESGKIHHASNADVITHPASLTKMMTLYLTFQALREGRLSLDQRLPVSRQATAQIPSKLWLKPGGTLTVLQAILGLVTKSANDASVVLAEALGNGSEANFAKRMTQQARKLGMNNTIFKNSSGVPNKEQITTARDMAVLSRALYLHFPEYFNFFKAKEFAYKGTVHKNHNHLLGKVKGVDGIKTGFTCASGFNLAASMVRDNRRLIAVVLGGESIKARDKKMAQLLETTYERVKNKLVPQKRRGRESIGDLIHSLGSSDVYKASSHPQKAVYLSRGGEVESLEAKYESLDELFNVIQPASVKTYQHIVKAKSSPSPKSKIKPSSAKKIKIAPQTKKLLKKAKGKRLILTKKSPKKKK